MNPITDAHLANWLGDYVTQGDIDDFRNFLAWECDIFEISDAPSHAWPGLTAAYWQNRLDRAGVEL